MHPLSELDEYSNSLIAQSPVSTAHKKADQKQNQAYYADDAWSQLHKGKTYDCLRKKTLGEVVAVNRGADGLPELHVLAEMCTFANNLDVKSTKGKYGEKLSAIYFHITLYNTLGGKESSKLKLFDNLVSRKNSSRVCYENEFLPLDVKDDGHLLVHQTLAPCKLCRAGTCPTFSAGIRWCSSGFTDTYFGGLFPFHPSTTSTCVRGRVA